jgi:integrase
MKQVQRLKKVINMGLNYQWITRSPFIGYNIRFKPYDKIILTADELSNIEKLSGLNAKLSLTRDAFVFSCYTGLAFVDLKNLTYDNVGIDGNLWIITRRKKTDVKARIPLLPKALELMECYKGHPKLQLNHVIPLYSNQKTNDYLKELAALAEIKKPLTFHCGRHIFATVITLANGVPIETVSKALGHKDLRTTQIYARVLDEKIAKDFTNLKNSLQK